MPITEIAVDEYDAALFVGGQAPMYTFFDDERVHDLVTSFYEAGKVTAAICHATCVLLKTPLSDGRLLVDGSTTGSPASTTCNGGSTPTSTPPCSSAPNHT